jgi:dTDP-4-amino-4,6-dideoxygalactose transaminase
MHLQPRLMENPPVALPVSEKLSAEGICLPIHHHLSIGDVDRIVETIQSFY